MLQAVRSAVVAVAAAVAVAAVVLIAGGSGCQRVVCCRL